MSYSSWKSAAEVPDYEDPNVDRIEGARREEAEDAFDAVAVTCINGHRYDPKRVRATRTAPAYVRVDCCPECGMDQLEERDDNG